MPILRSQGSAWSLAALLGVSAAAASACAAWFALGSAAAWQHQKTLTSSCSSCWLDNHALTTSKCTQTILDTIWLYRGVKLVASQMVGLDDLPITSSESEFTASSGDEDIFELYEWIYKEGCRPFQDKEKSIKLLCHRCQYKRSVNSMCRNVLDVNKQYCNTMSQIDKNSNRIDHWKENMQNWDRKYNNSGQMLIKISFLLHQYPPCIDRQCCAM